MQQDDNQHPRSHGSFAQVKEQQLAIRSDSAVEMG
ncbi:hypothetical protein YERSI8AC_150023 [Enterobacterales bacterium 8AC]|nr:hypothetical protein YERSI8AC_150023 [Enterobacterales bacterium 8AC]